MKIALFAFLMFFSFATLACRPNIHQIQHQLTMKALGRAYVQNNLSILKLLKVELFDFKMEWRNRDSGIQCPDFYEAILTAQYTSDDGALNLKITVNSQDSIALIEEN